ncbi:transglycosylase SLT domain-containing protein [Campylobacter sp. JMF_04 NA10]|uniref:transglycosylase SLT domain-containing protein n=1 Tax=Campylobacter sp. JMF_04 NA10 TaxID=2983824 RepID=UPI0022E9E277|nr:transglycosylase SLT domain-containing protein [Campylobacter sp. JMF_04 NA10]MDA3075858.1 transglycosylase SLT domain-containing protein [Campylobacter sp. JMF_04 NA10]
MKILFKFSLAVALCASFATANVKSYEEIKNEPKSLAKDYYIYRLATETKYDKNELKALRKAGIYRYRGKIKKELDKILGAFKALPKPDKCAGVTSANILDANLTCQKARSYPAFVAKLSPKTRSALISKFENSGNLGAMSAINLLKGFNSGSPAQYFKESGHAQNYFSYYQFKGDESLLNINASPAFITDMAQLSGFKSVLEDAVIKRKYPNLRQSMLGINPQKVDKEIAFLLGVNALTYGDEAQALAYFRRAAATIESVHNSHNAKFWVYLLSKDENILRELAKSNYYSLYSLYAKEILGDKSLNIINPTPARDKISNYDIKNPFNWVRTKAKADKMGKAELLEFAKKFDTKESLGEWAYIMNKANGGRDNYYLTPFMEHIGTTDLHRQALILALGRQESRFIPSAVSTSYALGMMQFMPFVANDIAKKQVSIEGWDQDMMFDPKIAYKFANIHIDTLETKLLSPVFIAYAYNGGLEFTSKLLKRADLFNMGKYEPFLSMELVTFAESRDYGKKVLANYVIYSHILNPNSKVSVREELDKLLIPSKSDKIR